MPLEGKPQFVDDGAQTYLGQDVTTTANEAVDAQSTADSKVETKSCPDEDRHADELCGTVCAPIHEENDGSGPTGTAADIFQQERTQYWALCPASQSVLLRMANTKGVNFMVFSTTRIQGHEAYQEVLQHIRHYKMNLVIELPKEDRKEASGRMMKTFSRLKVYVEAANNVFIIAPKTNP